MPKYKERTESRSPGQRTPGEGNRSAREVKSPRRREDVEKNDSLNEHRWGNYTVRKRKIFD